MDENLRWLLNWFNSKCDGQWELGEAFVIGTLDNPGWCFWIRTEQTELQNQNFQKIRIDRTEDDWVRCYIEEGMFKGCGGPSNLPEVLQIFRDWAESAEIHTQTSPKSLRLVHQNLKPQTFQINTTHNKDNLTWLTDWFYSQCDGDWEHCFGIGINNLNGSEGFFKVGISETELEDKPFEAIEIKRSDSDWVQCSISTKIRQGRPMFVGYGGLLNLPEMIKVFRDWAENIEIPRRQTK